MRTVAASFAVRAQNPERVARALVETAAMVQSPKGALVFVAGPLMQRLNALNHMMGRERLGFPVLCGSGAGLITERGEIEGEAAAVGLVWAGGEARVVLADSDAPEARTAALVEQIRPTFESAAGTCIALFHPTSITPQSLEPLRRLESTVVLGGGTVGGSPVFAVDDHGEPRSGRAGAMLLRGIEPPLVRTAGAARLLMPMRRITQARGPMVLEIDGERALSVLSAVAKDLSDQPLVLVALSREERSPSETRPPVLLRTVQGVDPARQGIVVSDDVRPGMFMAFAVRDASAARSGLETMSREVARTAAGALPLFGVYFSCAGRGTALYRAPDVESRILRAQFRDMPFVGLQSAFEIGPHEGGPALCLYTGVLGLFTAPS